MRRLTGLTDDPKQQFAMVIEGYDAATVTLEYKSSQYAWFMSVVWGNFELYGERVATGPNMLRQFKDIIPFGIAVSGNNAIDPLFLTSWLTDCSFYVLDAADVESAEAYFVR